MFVLFRLFSHTQVRFPYFAPFFQILEEYFRCNVPGELWLSGNTGAVFALERDFVLLQSLRTVIITLTQRLQSQWITFVASLEETSDSNQILHQWTIFLILAEDLVWAKDLYACVPPTQTPTEHNLTGFRLPAHLYIRLQRWLEHSISAVQSQVASEKDDLFVVTRAVEQLSECSPPYYKVNVSIDVMES